MNDIKVDYFIVSFHGDESVGIFSGSWRLGDEFYFETPQDLQGFKEKLKQAFGYCADESCIDVQTDQEYEDMIDEEDRRMRAAEEAERDIGRFCY
jgi:hypothetical protein